MNVGQAEVWWKGSRSKAGMWLWEAAAAANGAGQCGMAKVRAVGGRGPWKLTINNRGSERQCP